MKVRFRIGGLVVKLAVAKLHSSVSASPGFDSRPMHFAMVKGIEMVVLFLHGDYVKSNAIFWSSLDNHHQSGRCHTKAGCFCTTHTYRIRREHTLTCYGNEAFECSCTLESNIVSHPPLPV